MRESYVVSFRTRDKMINRYVCSYVFHWLRRNFLNVLEEHARDGRESGCRLDIQEVQQPQVGHGQVPKLHGGREPRLEQVEVIMVKRKVHALHTFLPTV